MDEKYTQKIHPDPYIEVMIQDEILGSKAIVKVVPNGLVFLAVIDGMESNTYFYPWTLIDEAREKVSNSIQRK